MEYCNVPVLLFAMLFHLYLFCFSPEDSVRLFDLVKSKDPKFLTAFYFALRDTLVARDLEQATRVGLGRTRYRVVTLTGQLVDMAGESCYGTLH